MSCAIVQLFLIVQLFSEQTYQFFYSVSVSMILVPYFFATLFALVCAVKKDGYASASSKMVWFYRVAGLIGFLYSVFLVYAGGMQGLMITTILFAPGIILYAVGEKQRGEAVLPKAIDKVVAAAIVVFFVVSIVLIATGQISVI